MKLTGDRNQCPSCSEFFNSSRAFDKHRTGGATQRRCLSVPEMQAKGMLKNNDMFWVTKLRSPDAPGSCSLDALMAS